MAEQHYDIVIAGGGIVGLTLANALKHAGLTIAVIEQHPPEAVIDAIDLRVSAINRASLQAFNSIGVVDETFMQRACAFGDMHVWDSTGAGEIHFDSAEHGLDALGHIIENNVIQNALLKGLESSGTIAWLCPAGIEHIETTEQQHSVHLNNGDTLVARLLVGADGARSVVRAAAGIDFIGSAYEQQGVVCNVTTEYEHQYTAWQCFMPSGPLAFLPLFDGRCSIVWSLDNDMADAMLALEDEAFARELEQAFQFRLGAVTAVSQRAAFPLGHGHVNAYVQPGLALVGDAAHTIHPLAGQGANLGIMDAMALADVIRQALQQKRQWYAEHSLRRYERMRKADNRLMETTMTGFKWLFGNNNPFIATLRNAGLNLTDRLPLVKHRLMQHAMGVTMGPDRGVGRQ